MNRLTWLLGEIADRAFPIMAVCGLLLSVIMLGNADDAQHIFWSLCALGLSGVAMWAFWSEK